MSSGGLILGLYKPGNSFLHKASTPLKLLFLFVAAIAISVFKSPAVSAGGLVLALAAALIARIRMRDLFTMVRGFLVVLLALFAFQTWISGPAAAFASVGSLAAIIILASVMTATTPVDNLAESFSGLFKPLRFLGVKPEVIGFSMALVLQTIPSLLIVARETREAAKARGLSRNPRALLIPFVTRTVSHALTLGEALQARGLPDEVD